MKFDRNCLLQVTLSYKLIEYWLICYSPLIIDPCWGKKEEAKNKPIFLNIKEANNRPKLR